MGCHGIYVAAGLTWLVLMMLQLALWDLRPVLRRRPLCFALFWHALDIIWVMIFGAAYLIEVA